MLLAPVLLVAAVLVALQTDVVERIAKAAVEQAVTNLTGERLYIRRIELSYVPLRLTVRGVQLDHPADGARIAGLDTLSVTLGIANWRPALTLVELEKPTVELHLDPDGLREFRALPKGKGGGSKLPERFPWEALIVHDANFVLHLDDKDLVALDDLDVDPAGERWRVSVASIRVRKGTFERVVEPFVLDDVDLTPTHVAIPALAIKTVGFSVEGTIAAGFATDAPLAGDLSVHADLASLTHGENPDKFVDGLVDLDATLGGTTGNPTAEGALLARAVALHGVNSKGEPFVRAFGDVAGPWSYAEKKAHVGPLQMQWETARIGVGADFDLTTKELTASVTAEDLRLGEILRDVGVHKGAWVDFLADVEIHVAGGVSPFALDGTFELNGADLQVTSGPFDTRAPRILTVPDGRLAGQLHIDGTHFIIDAGEANFGPVTRGRARADVPLKPDGELRVDVAFSRLDLGDLAPLGNAQLGGIARAEGVLQGPLNNLHASLDLDGQNLQVLDFLWADRFTAHLDSPDLKRLQFTQLDATLGATHYRGNIELAFPPSGMTFGTQLYITDGYLRDLTGIFVNIPHFDGKVAGTLVLNGPIYRMNGEAQLDLTDIDLFGEPFQTGHLTGWMDDGIFTLEELRMLRPKETVMARGTVGRGWAMDMEVLSDGLALERLKHLEGTNAPVRGAAVLDARVGGTLFDWRPEGRITLRHTRFANKAVDDSTIFFHTEDPQIIAWNGALVGDSLQVGGHLGMRGKQQYDLHADFDRFPLDILYPVAADGNPVVARLTGSLDLGGQFGDNPTPVEIRGSFDRVYAAWNGHELKNPEPWVFRMTGTEVTIPNLRLMDQDETDISIDGQTSLNGYVALRGGGTVELDLVRAFAPGITEARGTATVQLGISGSREAGVNITVDGRIRRGEVRTEFFPEPLEDLDATFHATPSGYDITTVSARVGGGTLDASGRIEAENWWPTRYDLRASVREARVKYFDSLPAMRGNAELHFDGPVGALQLGGRIDVTDMTWAERIPWEEWVVSLPGRGERLTDGASAQRKNYFSFDLDIVGDRTVRMRNNVGDLDASVRLNVAGNTARPEMTGSITVDPGGLVYFNGRQLEVNRGEIRYLDPTSFDPDLDMQLATDIRGQQEDYHVNVNVSGLMSEKKVTSSGEGLSEADANSLLITGMTQAEFERYGGYGAAIAQGADLLGKQLGEGQLFGVDRWNVVSGISERGSTVLSNELRVVAEKDVGGFTFTVESSLGSFGDVYGSVERRLAKRLYATVYYASKQQGRSLDIGGAYGAEFKFRWELD